MRLSCPDYTWPSLPHHAALDLIAALDFEAVDVGFMTGRSHVLPERVGSDARRAGEQVRSALDARELAVADVFAIPAADFLSLAANSPDPAAQGRSLAYFETAIAFAQGLGANGLTTLPGMQFPDDTFADALQRSADGLRRRIEMAADAGLALSVEPHAESIIDTPDKTWQLLDLLPELKLTVDHAHHIYSGADQSDIDALLPAARHLQCRPGRPGALQVRVVEDAIDFRRVVDLLTESGYDGYLAIEFVWQDWLDCYNVDTVGETALMRDRLRSYDSERKAERA